jgi:hypothetical protein
VLESVSFVFYLSSEARASLYVVGMSAVFTSVGQIPDGDS